MDRERLLKKREALKAKLEIESRLSRINELVKYLDRNGIEYRIHLDCEKANEALYSYRIDGSKKANAVARSLRADNL